MGGLFSGHSLIVIKWTWGFLSLNLQFDTPSPHTIRHKRVYLALNSTYNKHKLCKTFDYWSRHMLNFLEKSLGIVFQPHFVYDFSRKMFLIFYKLAKSHCLITFTSWDNWLNLIVWLPLLPEILANVSCNCLFPRLWLKFWK